ncbi:MAG: DUF4317 domain-containing protein [Clostridia bacterium]|nr:DUF4317 domain-containing protein [Clostridia bacterium]
MNRKEIAEIRRRFNIDKNAISCVRGCYVNERREIVSTFNRPLLSFPQEEAEKYLAIFKRTLAGIPGKNLIDIEFRPDQVMDDDAHRLLMGLRNTALTVDQGVEQLFEKIIASLNLEGHYLILMMHDAYDVPFRTKDDMKVDEINEEVFSYILLSVCPVKMTKPALSYFAEDNDFHARESDWVVTAPELGFMFPTFDDRAANIYSALYYTRDASEMHDEFIEAVFNTDKPVPAPVQRETFQTLLEDTLEENLNLEVVQTVHEQIRDMIEVHNQDKTAEPLVISKREVTGMLESCGVPEEKVVAFEEKYDEQFGLGMPLKAANIVEPKKFEVRTPDVVVQVNPLRSDLVETRVIDGFKYILIRADEGVEVNGVNISIGGAAPAPASGDASYMSEDDCPF